MEIYRKSVGILTDNEENYLSLLSGIIDSIDEFSVMLVIKNPTNFQFKISPSEAILIPLIIKEINQLNNMCNIHVEYSKSMKNSASVDFSLSLQNELTTR